ncbi:DNA-directed RNA polymerase subunit beta [Pediococcus ethanolidurans]|nr:DNA-directed RNA polymerase subunit beta [Pediococcus ethanolidurans]MBU7560236.1 DNA-directed RNA polymerase subunit beta [Levilactobacillus brevis]MCT4399094.1 DNA-directed RNA polymerase subunit beta [Pediococcus ethanolidurans]MQN23515.1 DNA-directed RNA polymerase subunit beta [Lentilactobacillus buchneri]
MADAYQRQQPVTIQLKKVDQNNRHLPYITTLIHDHNANDIVIDSGRVYPTTRNLQCAYKKTEGL